MVADYKYKLPIEVYWQSRDGTINSSYYATRDEAESEIASITVHNKLMGYTGTTEYMIRKRVAISRPRKAK